MRLEMRLLVWGDVMIVYIEVSASHLVNRADRDAIPSPPIPSQPTKRSFVHDYYCIYHTLDAVL